jgi:hypothetical protein
MLRSLLQGFAKLASGEVEGILSSRQKVISRPNGRHITSFRFVDHGLSFTIIFQVAVAGTSVGGWG